MCSGPQRTLRLYLDLGCADSGEHLCAMIGLGEAGDVRLERREILEPGTPRECMYAAFLSMLEEAVVLQGHGLQVFLAPAFRAIDLGFDPAREGPGAPSLKELEICRRIRELSSAFTVVSPALLGEHEVNPARQYLSRQG